MRLKPGGAVASGIDYSTNSNLKIEENKESVASIITQVPIEKSPVKTKKKSKPVPYSKDPQKLPSLPSMNSVE